MGFHYGTPTYEVERLLHNVKRGHNREQSLHIEAVRLPPLSQDNVGAEHRQYTHSPSTVRHGCCTRDAVACCIVNIEAPVQCRRDSLEFAGLFHFILAKLAYLGCKDVLIA